MVFFADHAAVGANVEGAVVGIAGHHAARSHDVAAAVERIPLGHRQLIKIDTVALDDVFFDRSLAT